MTKDEKGQKETKDESMKAEVTEGSEKEAETKEDEKGEASDHDGWVWGTSPKDEDTKEDEEEVQQKKESCSSSSDSESEAAELEAASRGSQSSSRRSFFNAVCQPGRQVAAKMLIYVGHRCACHFISVHDCPNKRQRTSLSCGSEN